MTRYKRTKLKILRRFSIFALILPIFTIIYLWDLILSNILIFICSVLAILTVGIYISYLIKPPSIEDKIIKYFIFVKQLKKINIDFVQIPMNISQSQTQPFRRLVNKQNEFPMKYPQSQTQEAIIQQYDIPVTQPDTLKKDEGFNKDILNKFWLLFINIEGYFLLIFLSVPSIMMLFLSRRFDIIIGLLYILDFILVFLFVIWTILRAWEVKRTRNGILKKINEYTRSEILFGEYPSKDSEVINQLLEFLDISMWIYPMFYRIYAVTSIIIGGVGFLIEYL